MNISIEFGNIWEALSAVGTIGAVGVSLWLAMREERSIFSVNLKTSFGITKDNSLTNAPLLSIDAFNVSRHPLIIEEVGFVKSKNGEKLVIYDSNIFVDGSNGLNFKTESKASATYTLDLIHIQQATHRQWGDNIKIRAYVRDSSGKKHFSKKHKI